MKLGVYIYSGVMRHTYVTSGYMFERDKRQYRFFLKVR